MTGISSYSTTASENVQANTGINWDEGMSPAAVNNSARANMADERTQWNDAGWFQYGIGSKTVAAVYASGTSFTLAGGDATAYWHTGRRVRAVGASTGIIYGKVSSSSYGAATTTVNVTWDSGSLSNETLAIYASTIPVTGYPVELFGNVTATGAFSTSSNSGYTVSALGEAMILNASGLTSTTAITCIADTGGVILNEGAGSWSSISDYRAKIDHGLLTNSGEIIDSVPVHLAALTSQPGKIKPMFFAHELQRALPHAVYGEKDGEEMQRIETTDPAVPVLWAEIKSLRARLAAAGL